MRKLPNRMNNDISQAYTSGIVKIYDVTNVAEPGRKPVEGLAQKETLRYEELRLGITRYYSGKQAQVDIERVLRMPRRVSVSAQDVAVTEDGKQYRIELVQLAQDVYPPSMDLTLARIEQEYEVPQ